MAKFKLKGKKYVYKKKTEDMIPRVVQVHKWDALVDIMNDWYRNAYEDSETTNEGLINLINREREQFQAVHERMNFWRHVAQRNEDIIYASQQQENLERRILREIFDDEPEIKARYRQVLTFDDDEETENEGDEEREEAALERYREDV